MSRLQNAAVQTSITNMAIRIEAVKYPDKNIELASILATIGDNPKRWYKYTEFLQHDGAEEELRRWGPKCL
jgi:hypothetical protein